MTFGGGITFVDEDSFGGGIVPEGRAGSTRSIANVVGVDSSIA